MIDFLSQPPASLILLLAGLLFVACLLIWLTRRARMARCGVCVGAAAVLFSAAAVVALLLPLSFQGAACGISAGAFGLNSPGGECGNVLKSVFDTALWLAMAGAAAAFLSFAPGLRTAPSTTTSR